MTMTTQAMPQWMQDRAYRFGIDEYHRLVESGVLPRNIELIDGVLVEKVTNSPQHSNVVDRLLFIISRSIGDGFIVRIQNPLTIGNSEPEPDVAIVAGSFNDFKARHPGSALLVIEVANSSLAQDRAKCSIYAQAGIPEYWIINLQNATIERYTEPTGAGYQKQAVLPTRAQLVVPGCSGLVVQLADLV